jgi:AraC-like DNA-binding protein
MSRWPSSRSGAWAEPGRPPELLEERTRRRLFGVLGVDVIDFRCRAQVDTRGVEEVNQTHSIVFVRRGAFARTDREGTLVADANHVLFFNEGQPYRFSHPLPGGDECTILTLEEECARAAARRWGGRRAGAPGPFPRGRAPATPRAARLHFELLSILEGAAAPPALAAQETVGELIEEAVRSCEDVGVRVPEEPSRGSRRRRDLVEEAKLLLNGSVEEPPSLTDLAAALDCSPFHLSRTFRAATGLGLRHYLSRLRCRLAAERLARGHEGLTALALDLGFYDHSHFTHAFRREWGVPPSRLRRSRSLT